jgi:hypothetical protein
MLQSVVRTSAVCFEAFKEKFGKVLSGGGSLHLEREARDLHKWMESRRYLGNHDWHQSIKSRCCGMCDLFSMTTPVNLSRTN